MTTDENKVTLNAMFEGLNWHLRPRKQEILNSFNRMLVKLYADIGKACVAYLDRKALTTGDEKLKQLSDQLVPYYGDVFSVSLENTLILTR